MTLQIIQKFQIHQFHVSPFPLQTLWALKMNMQTHLLDILDLSKVEFFFYST